MEEERNGETEGRGKKMDTPSHGERFTVIVRIFGVSLHLLCMTIGSLTMYVHSIWPTILLSEVFNCFIANYISVSASLRDIAYLTIYYNSICCAHLRF